MTWGETHYVAMVFTLNISPTRTVLHRLRGALLFLCNFKKVYSKLFRFARKYEIILNLGYTRNEIIEFAVTLLNKCRLLQQALYHNGDLCSRYMIF